MKTEGEYKTDSLKRLQGVLMMRYGRCLIMKNDPTFKQGMPDQIVIVEPFHVFLEYKRSKSESHRPNQDYYVNLFNKQGGYAAFIYPDIEQQIFQEVIAYFDMQFTKLRKGETTENDFVE